MKYENLMNVRDLCLAYKVCPTTMRTLLGRSEFSPFCVGKHRGKEFGRMEERVATYYDCTKTFHKQMKKLIEQKQKKSRWKLN